MYDILTGLTVVEASAFVAAPLGGMTLAQMGAEVIRVDPVGGGIDARRWPLAKTADGEPGDSLYWAGLNKAKKSVLLNLRDPDGQALYADLVVAARNLLTNLPSGGWNGYETLSARRPDLIQVQVTGNRDGSTAVDYTVNSAVGYPLATGPAGDDRPVNHLLPAWDVATGLMAALGLMAADRQRVATGQGRFISLALSDVALATVGHLGHIGEWQINGTQREKGGNDLYGAFGRDFATADGGRVMVAAISRRQWRGLVKAADLAQAVADIQADTGLDLDQEGQRYQARGAIAAALAPWIAARPLAAVAAAFDAQGVCWGPYRSFGELVDSDPRCSPANPMFAEVDQPGIGRYLMPGLPLEFAGLRRRPTEPAPRLGQHTEEVLADRLGLSDAAIGRLLETGVAANRPD